MNTDITIRRWAESDWKIFKAIRLESLSAHADLFGPSYNVESAKDDAFWKECINQGGAVFGLYDKEIVIGLTGVYRYRASPADTAILCMSYIRAEYRGRGLSDLLYKARIDWAKQQDGIIKVLVEHREGNEASRRANQRWGFVFHSIKEQVYGNGETAKEYMYELRI